MELHGTTIGIETISTDRPLSPLRPSTLRLQDSFELNTDPLRNQDSMLESIGSESVNFDFGDFHGRNIVLKDDKRSAYRIQSYSNAVVSIARPLFKGQNIKVLIKFFKNQTR